MVSNPAGAVNITDGGVPRTLTVLIAENTSGGNFVQWSGAADAVSSGLNSFVSADLRVVNDGSGGKFAGIALSDYASGTTSYGAIATRGTFIVTSAGTIPAGVKVYANGAHAVAPVPAGSISDHNFPIGRALTGAGSEGYVVVDLGGV